MDYKKNPPDTFKNADELSKQEARDEIASLTEAIDYHDYLYYVKNQPAISDARYDALFHRLEELEETFPEFRAKDSPTRRVGAEPVSELKKVKHRSPMLSLNAAHEKKRKEKPSCSPAAWTNIPGARPAKKLVEHLGARAASSVSSNTDYVVAGEDPGRKYDDAQSEHVEILDEAHFERLLNERKK